MGDRKRQRTDDDEMCRDYNKGTCFRGERCKFRHPKEELLEEKRIPFCKDFRYSTCKFRDCIYVHGPELLEDEYRKTGWIPRFVLKHCLDRFNLCIQYLKEKGECSKADCKFGHSMLGLELESEDFEFGTQCYHGMSIEQLARATGLCLEFVKENCAAEDCKYKHLNPKEAGVGNDKTTWAEVQERESNNGYIRAGRGGGLLDNVGHHNMGMHAGGGEELMMLRRDNEMLRMEVMDLRKKNEGLQATNQFLLEENASMRMKNQGGSSNGGYSAPASTNSAYPSAYPPATSGGYSGSAYGAPPSGGYPGAGASSSAYPPTYPGYGGAGAGGYYGGGGGYNSGTGGQGRGGGRGRFNNYNY